MKGWCAMPNFPCPIANTCLPCSESSPFANLSSENPDPITFLAVAFSTDPPDPNPDGPPPDGAPYIPESLVNWCYDPVSQQLAMDCATRKNVDETHTPSFGRGPDYGNNEQNCSTTCPDGTVFNFTLPANTVRAASQALADLQAQSICQTRAFQQRICASNAKPSPGCVGVDYSFQPVVTGGTPFPNGQPFLWNIVSGSLPPGLSLNTDTGQISGVPAAYGQYPFTLQIADYNFQIINKTYTICIFEIATTSLPDGVIGQAYSSGVTANPSFVGGFWQIKSGSLPQGLILNFDGTITGVPAGACGNFTVEVEYVVNECPL